MATLFDLSSRWLGVPFRWHGFTKLGCDCVGLIIGILSENGVIGCDDLYKIKKISYGTNLAKIDKRLLEKFLLMFFVRADELIDADLLLVRTRYSPIHFVIFEKGKPPYEARIRHITQEVGYVFENNFCQDDWKITGMFRLIRTLCNP